MTRFCSVLIRTAKYGDGAPESADLLFLYGKALLENAIAQADVIKKDDAENALKAEKQGKPKGWRAVRGPNFPTH